MVVFALVVLLRVPDVLEVALALVARLRVVVPLALAPFVSGITCSVAATVATLRFLVVLAVEVLAVLLVAGFFLGAAFLVILVLVARFRVGLVAVSPSTLAF